MKRQRKKKFSIKKTLRLVIPLLFIILGIVLFINKDNLHTYYLTKTTGYDELTITTIKDNNLNTAILNKKYSKTLESIINSEYFNSEYLDEYLDIEYHDKDNFLSL